ncbi:MAG: hypothetical protein U5K71_03130 [Gracilimonas sp.]|nr:hypothetical protein [Gracilimonas sp.]
MKRRKIYLAVIFIFVLSFEFAQAQTQPDTSHAFLDDFPSHISNSDSLGIEITIKQYRLFLNQTRYILRINDISLPSGGLFDVKKSNYWSTPHKEHRTGKQADIGVKGIDKKNECVDISEDIIVPLIKENTGNKLLIHRGSSAHYHIRY